LKEVELYKPETYPVKKFIFLFVIIFLILASNCDKKEIENNPNPLAQIPIVSTQNVTDITETTAISGGNVVSNDTSLVLQKGVCWSTNSNPTISDPHTMDGIGSGNYISKIAGLTSNTLYYLRAYATNNNGTGYGNQFIFTTNQGNGDSVTDINGNVYRTIKIGTQIWMVENLKTNKYRNGEYIKYEGSNYAWPFLTIGARCYYDNLKSNDSTYGTLYNFYTLTDPRNIAPLGWHVPNDHDWENLFIFLGGESVAGGKLKETGTIHWLDFNYATNESGFTALPGGFRDGDASFHDLGYYGYWWSSSCSLISMLNVNTSVSVTPNVNPYIGLSVRCVKD